MTKEQAIGFWGNIPHLQAKRMREKAAENGIRLTASQMYHVVLMETGDEEKASKAMANQMQADLRANVTPE